MLTLPGPSLVEMMFVTPTVPSDATATPAGYWPGSLNVSAEFVYGFGYTRTWLSFVFATYSVPRVSKASPCGSLSPAVNTAYDAPPEPRMKTASASLSEKAIRFRPELSMPATLTNGIGFVRPVTFG